MPLEAATLELVDSGARVLSDAAGRYVFRAVSPGRYTLLVDHVGYARRSLQVELEQGRTLVLDVELPPLPVMLPGLEAVASGTPVEATRVGREQIERSGAVSAGDVLRGLPGVVVRSTAPGGPVTASVRGGAPDAVLVLVDGMVLNDPVTGEADLSTVAAESIESVALLPGAQSARYGPRAEAGVIIIETRAHNVERTVRASAGSLDTRSAALVWGGARPFTWSVGGDWSALEGAFDFELPAEVGGGEGRRRNADARTTSFWMGASERVLGGEARIRGGRETAERGLPGRGYAPSHHARHASERLQSTATWRREGERGAVHVSAGGTRQHARFEDVQPPVGLPYHDSATISSLELRAEGERPATGDVGVGYGAGIDARLQWTHASALDASAPTRRLDLGGFVHGRVATSVGSSVLSISAQVRGDRDDRSDWTVSHSLTVGATLDAGVHTYAALRSSYTPPALADQYFRGAIGVQPNPDLRAERVPSEIEAGIRTEHAWGLRAGFGVTAYRSDVRGMIVWAPDYRFVWSPRNVDVERFGVEARASAETADGRVRVALSHTSTRIVYDQPPPDDDVQVVYRPRNASSAELDWSPGAWRVALGARFTGVRNTVPAQVNTLPSFWTTSAAASREWRLGRWTLTPTLRADRLFDEKGSLIFGFPEPGRTLRVDVALRYAPRNLPLETGSR
jgi:outer membrane cobalamin receptor